ncbi:MAG: TIGR04211 family SH3 domain-containing protein [Pseudomonadota bacterium]
MINKITWLIGVSFFLTSQMVSAETKYVTDDLKLALHADEGSKGKLLQRLQSGTQLEVLEESGLFAKVRTPDGTIGWTKAGFLMTGKPARARVLELEQKQAQLEAALKKAGVHLTNSNKLAGELRAEKIQTALELAGHKEKKENDSSLIAKLTQDNADLREKIQSLEGSLPSEWSIPWHWGLAATAVSLLVGLLAGLALFDWFSRKRHGGYRIY